MPRSGFRIEPQFLSFPGGRRFILLLEPEEEQQTAGCILFVPPFAEEMQRSRRTVSSQARRLASAGYAVALLDLGGCGDSEGEFGDASWESWLEDVEHGLDWLSARHERPVMLWGLRLGGLLASDVASRRDSVARLLLWQPVLNGEQHIDQFLRVELAGQALKGESGFDRATLWGELRAGRPLDVAGYRISPQLAQQIVPVRLGAMLPECPVCWIDIGSSLGEPSRPNAAVMDRWRKQGVTVDYVAAEGAAFWRNVDSADSPLLLDATLKALEG